MFSFSHVRVWSYACRKQIAFCLFDIRLVVGWGDWESLNNWRPYLTTDGSAGVNHGIMEPSTIIAPRRDWDHSEWSGTDAAQIYHVNKIQHYWRIIRRRLSSLGAALVASTPVGTNSPKPLLSPQAFCTNNICKRRLVILTHTCTGVSSGSSFLKEETQRGH